MKTLLCIIFVSLQAFSSVYSDWTQFRGQNGQGTSSDKHVPTQLNQDTLAWKISPKGKGHGSPVIKGERVFLITANPEKSEVYLESFNLKSGKQLWLQSFSLENHRMHRHNFLASSTPALGENLIYTLWGSPNNITAMAFDMDGKVIWKRDLGPHQSKHGFALSPFYYDGQVFISHQHLGKSTLYALHAKTGQTNWRLDAAEGRTAYGLPCIYKGHLVFSSSGTGLMGVDPKNAKVLWQISDVHSKRNLSGPVIAGDLILSTCGSGGGGNALAAVEPKLDEKSAKLRYTLKRNISYVPKPLVHNGLIFIVADTGRTSCYDAKSGERLWKERIDGKVYTSPILIDNKIYVITHEGDVHVYAARKQYQYIGKSSLNDLCFSTPAVSQNHLVIHSFQNLFCFTRSK